MKRVIGKIKGAIRYLAMAYAIYCSCMLSLILLFWFLGPLLASSLLNSQASLRVEKVDSNFFGRYKIEGLHLRTEHFALKASSIDSTIDWPRLFLFHLSIPLVHIERLTIQFHPNKDAAPISKTAEPSTSETELELPKTILPIDPDLLFIPFQISFDRFEISSLNLDVDLAKQNRFKLQNLALMAAIQL